MRYIYIHIHVCMFLHLHRHQSQTCAVPPLLRSMSSIPAMSMQRLAEKEPRNKRVTNANDLKAAWTSDAMAILVRRSELNSLKLEPKLYSDPHRHMGMHELPFSATLVKCPFASKHYQSRGLEHQMSHQCRWVVLDPVHRNMQVICGS